MKSVAARITFWEIYMENFQAFYKKAHLDGEITIILKI